MGIFRLIAVGFLILGLAAMAWVLVDNQPSGRSTFESAVVAEGADLSAVGSGAGSVSTDSLPSPFSDSGPSVSSGSLPVGVIESVGSVVVGPVSEFFGVEPTAGAYRWVGAASPLLLSLVFWVIPSPFKRKSKIDL